MSNTIANHEVKERFVGADLQDSEESRGIVKAILKDNPDTKVSHYPGFIKLQSHDQLLVRRETVEQELRRPWDTQEFNMCIITYVGDIQEWDEDHILVKWNTD